MVLQALTDFYNLLTSPALQAELFPARVIFLFFGFSFLILTLYFVFNSTYLHQEVIGDIIDFFDIQPANLRRIADRWRAIRKRVDFGTEYDFKLAIMGAEELFGDVLADKGFSGKTFDEKIREVEKAKMPNVEEILSAHRVRNMVAYDPNYKITKEEALKVITVFEKGIRGIESF